MSSKLYLDILNGFKEIAELENNSELLNRVNDYSSKLDDNDKTYYNSLNEGVNDMKVNKVESYEGLPEITYSESEKGIVTVYVGGAEIGHFLNKQDAIDAHYIDEDTKKVNPESYFKMPGNTEEVKLGKTINESQVKDGSVIKYYAEEFLKSIPITESCGKDNIIKSLSEEYIKCFKESVNTKGLTHDIASDKCRSILFYMMENYRDDVDTKQVMLDAHNDIFKGKYYDKDTIARFIDIVTDKSKDRTPDSKYLMSDGTYASWHFNEDPYIQLSRYDRSDSDEHVITRDEYNNILKELGIQILDNVTESKSNFDDMTEEEFTNLLKSEPVKQVKTEGVMSEIDAQLKAYLDLEQQYIDTDDEDEKEMLKAEMKEIELDTPNFFKWYDEYKLGQMESVSEVQDDPKIRDAMNSVGKSWEEVDTKVVTDSNGFTDEYTWYKHVNDDGTEEHVMIFGDRDFYTPYEDEPDVTFDNYDSAKEWFSNYVGLLDESKSNLNESYDVIVGIDNDNNIKFYNELSDKWVTSQGSASFYSDNNEAESILNKLTSNGRRYPKGLKRVTIERFPVHVSNTGYKSEELIQSDSDDAFEKEDYDEYSIRSLILLLGTPSKTINSDTKFKIGNTYYNDPYYTILNYVKGIGGDFLDVNKYWDIINNAKTIELVGEGKNESLDDDIKKVKYAIDQFKGQVTVDKSSEGDVGMLLTKKGVSFMKDDSKSAKGRVTFLLKYGKYESKKLNEEVLDLRDAVTDSYNHFVNDLGITPSVDDILNDITDNYDGYADIQDTQESTNRWYSVIAQELNRQALEVLNESISKNMTAEEIAKKHGVPLKDIEDQLVKGIKIEKEHTDDVEKATRIALDHLFEMPDYYDRLDKMEKCSITESENVDIIQWLKDESKKEVNRIKSEYGKDYLDKLLKNSPKKFDIGDKVENSFPEFTAEIIDAQFYPRPGMNVNSNWRYILKIIDPKNTTYKSGDLYDFAVANYEVKKIESSVDDSLNEDTVKQGSHWVNKGKEGTHGKFKTKKAADAQRRAMYANEYQAESLDDEFIDEDRIADSKLDGEFDQSDEFTDEMDDTNYPLANELNHLIKDEFDAIDGYNDLIDGLEQTGSNPGIVDVLKDINSEENVHVGQLQAALKTVTTSADKIKDGEKEGDGQLADPSKDEVVTNTGKVISDDEFTDTEGMMRYADSMANESLMAESSSVPTNEDPESQVNVSNNINDDEFNDRESGLVLSGMTGEGNVSYQDLVQNANDIVNEEEILNFNK